jgi:hypothetical protein
MQYILRVTIDMQKTSKRGEAYLCRDSRGSECSSVALMLTCDPRLILQLPTQLSSTLRASRRVASFLCKQKDCAASHTAEVVAKPR